jgi:hypothetical protein
MTATDGSAHADPLGDPGASTARRARAQRVALVVAAVMLAALSTALPASAHSEPPIATVALERAVRNYAGTQAAQVSMAVYDVASDRTMVYRPAFHNITASIVKMDILETLLRREGELVPWERPLARVMIEHSDNAAASALWRRVGGGAGLGRYNRQAGLTATAPGPAGYWGLTSTTALDQLLLLRQIAFPSALLTGAQRRYALGLMRHVTPGQAWGVTGGATAGATVALKNGWLPHRGRWYVNSVGYVRGQRRRYLIAVLTAGTSFAAQVRTIDHLAALAWRFLRSDRTDRRRRAVADGSVQG